MKVFDLICCHGHRFEGWFDSTEDFATQSAASAVLCPVCDAQDVQRAPSAPRLNLGTEIVADIDAGTGPRGERALVASVIDRLRRAIAESENVGPRFAEEARRIHYDEAPPRSIRGTATANERRELDDEGIDILSIPPGAWTETLQ